MNPENPDEHKINKCDWIVIDGYSIKRGTMAEVLSQAMKLASSAALVMIINVSGLNSISK